MRQISQLNLPGICYSFPDLPAPMIDRTNILETIDTMLQDGASTVVVDGPDGIGKTTLLAQFSMRHSRNAISLFITPGSTMAYDPEVVRADLCNQVNWLLDGAELEPQEQVDASYFNMRLLALLRRAKNRAERFYFVVDGLDRVPEEHSDVRRIILGMMPWGYSAFRFLFSGHPNSFRDALPPNANFLPHHLPGFTVDEAISLLHEFELDRSTVAEIRQTFRGNPGQLATVRRILQAGVGIDELPHELSDLLEVEWQGISRGLSAEELELIALIANDRPHRLNDLCILFDTTESAIESLVSNTAVLTIHPISHEVRFVAEPLRHYVRQRLQHLQPRIKDKIIERLMSQQTSGAAHLLLPSYLEEAGRLPDLLDYLSPERFSQILESQASLVPVQQVANKGLKASQALGHVNHLVRFGINNSVIAGLSAANVWRSEIEALMALDDTESALALAQSATLYEDRLHLLTLIAVQKREVGLTPDEGLIDQIRQLYQLIHHPVNEDRAFEIASALIQVEPELAIDLIERSANAHGMDHGLDWAFAALSIAAHSAEQATKGDVADKLAGRINDPKLRQLSTGAALLVNNSTASEVIAEIEKLDGTSTRLYILRQWILENRQQADAHFVVDYALRLAIRSTTYSLNAKVMRDLASALPHLSDVAVAKTLVGIVDGQIHELERLGPTEDYVELQLLLAETESSYNIAAAQDRVDDVYLFIELLNDISVKAATMVQLSAALERIDPNKHFERTQDKLHTWAREQAAAYVSELLAGTAHQTEALTSIVRTLAPLDITRTADIINEMNTVWRRDHCLHLAAISSVEGHLDGFDGAVVVSVLQRIEDKAMADDALVRVLRQLANKPDHIKATINNFTPLAHQVFSIKDAAKRCVAAASVLRIAYAGGRALPERLVERLLLTMDTSWEAIDVRWTKVDVGFIVTKDLARISMLDAAHRWLKDTELERRTTVLDVEDSAKAYLFSVDLAIRAFSGMLQRGVDEDDIATLERLIDRVPSLGERATLWAQAALRCFAANKSDLGRNLVDQFVRPLWDSISPDDGAYRNRILIRIAPALYTSHQQTALDDIAHLPVTEDRDRAYYQVCQFIIRKHPTADPFEHRDRRGYSITYNDCRDLISILELIDADIILYGILVALVDSLLYGKNRDRISRAQRSDITRALDSLIASKLPRERHIQHEGYVIACKAELLRLERASSERWRMLIEEARDVPNVADRVFVLTLIAHALPNKERILQRDLLLEAIDQTSGIPVLHDRLGRLEAIANKALAIDKGQFSTIARQCFERAKQIASGTDDDNISTAYRGIIDSAHRFDPEFAASMVSITDDDPAKGIALREHKEQVKVLEFKQTLLRGALTTEDDAMLEHYGAVCWQMLGSLNAGLIPSRSTNWVAEHIARVAHQPIAESFPVFALAVESVSMKYRSTNEALYIVRPLFNALVHASELTYQMALRSASKAERIKTRTYNPDPDDDSAIRVMSREHALDFFRGWMSEHLSEYLIIVDAYFGPSDLELLQIVQMVKPLVKVEILTSRKHQRDLGILDTLEESYKQEWSRISDVEAPFTDVVVVGTESGKSPIHDRWWLTRGMGLRVGTSFNSIGRGGESEISRLAPSVADAREAEVAKYLYRQERQFRNERLRYQVFSL